MDTDSIPMVVIYAIFGLIVGFSIAYAITEFLWLLSPEGWWFNSDTIPLQQDLQNLWTTLVSPWTWLVFWPIGTIVGYIAVQVYEG